MMESRSLATAAAALSRMELALLERARGSIFPILRATGKPVSCKPLLRQSGQDMSESPSPRAGRWPSTGSRLAVWRVASCSSVILKKN